MPKLRNFAKSGHIEVKYKWLPNTTNLVTLKSPTSDQPNTPNYNYNCRRVSCDRFLRVHDPYVRSSLFNATWCSKRVRIFCSSQQPLLFLPRPSLHLPALIPDPDPPSLPTLPLWWSNNQIHSPSWLWSIIMPLLFVRGGIFCTAASSRNNKRPLPKYFSFKFSEILGLLFDYW